MPWFGLPLKHILLAGIFIPSFLNIFSAFIIIFTEGKGKNGSTVAVSFLLYYVISQCLLLMMYMYKVCWFNIPRDMKQYNYIILLTYFLSTYSPNLHKDTQDFVAIVYYV